MRDVHTLLLHLICCRLSPSFAQSQLTSERLPSGGLNVGGGRTLIALFALQLPVLRACFPSFRFFTSSSQWPGSIVEEQAPAQKPVPKLESSTDEAEGAGSTDEVQRLMG